MPAMAMGMVIPPFSLGENTTLKNPENPEGCHGFLTQGMAPFFGQLMTPKLWTRLKEHPNQVIFVHGGDGMDRPSRTMPKSWKTMRRPEIGRCSR